MRKILAVIAGALIPFISAGVAVVAIPEEEPAEAAAFNCVRWKEPWADGRNWAYLWCPDGKSDYLAVFPCVHWIGGVRLVHWPLASVGHAGVDVSAAWCRDGYHVGKARIRKVLL